MIFGEVLAERRRLLEQWDAVDSASEVLEIQERIAGQIRDAERGIKEGSPDRDALLYHISQLRLYADGLAWRLLHPHAIRQFAKEEWKPPLLIDQGVAFDRVLRCARQHVERHGLPVLVADITNILRIGDLVLVTNPELPQIVECKSRLPHPKYWMRGRMGRQISRALGTLRYLSGKPTKLYGEDRIRRVVECQHEPERNWGAVAACVGAALDRGEGFIRLSEQEVLFACPEPDIEGALKRASVMLKAVGSPLFLGTSEGLLGRFDGLFPPPIVWPLPAEDRFAVMEGDVVVVHLLCIAAFQGRHGELRIEVTPGHADRLSVFVEEREYRFSDRLIGEVLYGFETVQSCVRGLLAFARRADDLRAATDEAVSGLAVASEGPKVTLVDSREGDLRFAVAEWGEAVIVVSEDLWKSLGPPAAEADVADSGPEPG